MMFQVPTWVKGAVMNNTVLCVLLASTTIISSSVHAQNEPGSEDDLFEKFREENITIGGPLRGMTPEERRQILISIRNSFGDLDSKVPGVPVAPPPSGPRLHPRRSLWQELGPLPRRHGIPLSGPPLSGRYYRAGSCSIQCPGDPASWLLSEFSYGNRLEIGFQHGLSLIGVHHKYAAGITTPGQGTLGVINDTGIDLDHYDVGGIRLDLSHNYGDNPSDLSDTFPRNSGRGHGTGVFGVAGATRNQFGIVGVAPYAEFMILKSEEKDLRINFADALKRVIDAGADAMNNSWSLQIPINKSHTRERLLQLVTPDEIKQLRRSAESGVSIVFTTGNERLSEVNRDPDYEAALPIALPELEGNWIAVTGLNMANDLQSARISKRANWCGVAMNWCLAAPGEGIRTLVVGGLPYNGSSHEANTGTSPMTGTSFAAPHVTGAILLLKSEFPELTTPEIHKILFDTAYDLGAPGVDEVYGHGALDLRNAHVPQGDMMTELGEIVDQVTIPLSESWITESPVTGGTLAAALSDQSILVTDRYDRGYFASLGPSIVTASFSDTSAMQAGLGAAFIRTGESPNKTGFGLRFDAFGAGHDVTRIAHMDPVMTLVSQTAGTGFSMRASIGKATFSMANMTTPDASAVSLGAGLPFGDGHSITIFTGHAKETDSILGASVHGAFAGLRSETFYGRVQTDFTLGEKVTLNGSATVGQTSFNGTGLLSNGRADTLAMAFGLTLSDALADGDKLSFALARPLAVSGGQVTLRSGTGISSAVANRRTNRIDFAETTIPLKAADRAPELHLGYMHGFDAGWADAALAFGGVSRLDGGAKVMAARAELVFKF